MSTPKNLREYGKQLTKDVYASFQGDPVEDKQIENATILISNVTPEFEGTQENNSLDPDMIENIFNLEYL